MFELPELVVLAGQMNDTLRGKAILRGELGTIRHRFVWYNRSHEEFARLTVGKKVGHSRVRGKWLFVPLEPGYVVLLGECGGKVLYHPPGAGSPEKHHLCMSFEDGSHLSVNTRMWGAMELYEQGEEGRRQYIQGMRPTPIDAEFTFEYFSELIEELSGAKKRSAKELLTRDQMIPGLGNAIAQDILFRARLHPRRPIGELGREQRQALHGAILATVAEAIRKGGRCDEYDLYGRCGGYVRLMDARAAGRPCPRCGGTVEKMHYLGGACYFCPNCQQ